MSRRLIERFPAPVFVVAGAVLWATMGIFGKLAQGEGISALEVAFWRSAIGGVAFSVQAGVQRLKPPRGRDLAFTIGYAVIGVGVFNAVYQTGVQVGGASLASVMQYTAPAFVVVLSWLLLAERLRLRNLFAVAVTMAGVALISLGGGQGVNVGPLAIGLGLLSGLSYSTYYLYGKVFFVRYATPALYCIVMPVGALVLVPFIDFAPKSPTAMAYLVLLGVLTSWLAYLVHSIGLRRMSATRASVITSTEPVVAAFLAAALFGERLSILAILGAALVVVPAIVLGKPERRPPETTASHVTLDDD